MNSSKPVPDPHDEDLKSFTSEIQGINSPDTTFIFVQQGIAIPVNKMSGQIVGAHAGTLGIVIYGGNPETREGDRFGVARANSHTETIAIRHSTQLSYCGDHAS